MNKLRKYYDVNPLIIDILVTLNQALCKFETWKETKDKTNISGCNIFLNVYLITYIKLNDYCKMVQIMEIVLSESPKSNFDTGK